MEIDNDRELIAEKYSFKAKGETYTVLPFPFSYVLSPDFTAEMGLIGTPDKNTNFRATVNSIFFDEERKAVFEKWLNQYCLLKGENMTLEKIVSNEWTADDVGLFLLRLYGISG